MPDVCAILARHGSPEEGGVSEQGSNDPPPPRANLFSSTPTTSMSWLCKVWCCISILGSSHFHFSTGAVAHVAAHGVAKGGMLLTGQAPRG